MFCDILVISKMDMTFYRIYICDSSHINNKKQKNAFTKNNKLTL